MLNEDREVALQNILILSETQDVEVSIIEMAMGEGIQLIKALTGEDPTIRPLHADRYRLSAECDHLQVRVVTLPTVDLTPFGPIPEYMGHDENLDGPFPDVEEADEEVVD